MRIAVNTRFLIRNHLEGIGRHTLEITQRLVRDHPEVEWHFLFDRPYDPSFLFSPQVHPWHVFPPARHPLLWTIWFEFSLPRVFRKIRPDLFYSPDGYACLASDTPQVITIHDLAYLHGPDLIPRNVWRYYSRWVPQFARKAKGILTVSEYVKNDLITHLGVPGEKIAVSYNGISESFQPVSEETRQRIRRTYAQGHPFLIYSGAVHPRKNVHGLIRAFTAWKSAHPSDYRLIIAGRKAWLTGEVQQAWESSSFRDHILFHPELREDYYATVASAEILLYLSFEEGFGMPVTEAMQCGVPVITSTVSCLPETAGGAAHLCHPEDIHGIADAIQQIVSIQTYREELIRKGEKRCQDFSWDQAAAATWAHLVR